MEDFLEVLLVPLQAFEMARHHSHFTSVKKSVVDDCSINLDLGIFPEIMINENTLKEFPEGGSCELDPVLNFFIYVHCLRQVATELKEVLDCL